MHPFLDHPKFAVDIGPIIYHLSCTQHCGYFHQKDNNFNFDFKNYA